MTGFGLLFLGIDVLQGGMVAVQDKIPFDAFSANSISGKLILIVLGLIMTVIMQASSLCNSDHFNSFICRCY